MSSVAARCVVALVVLAAASRTEAQSAADLSARMHIDGHTDDFTPVEAGFRNADICPSLPPPIVCGADEEPATDSAGSALQDVHQIHVTWDAANLYLGVDATLGGQALMLFLDYRPGGLVNTTALASWRRALRFATDLAPDAFLAVRDAQAVPELWLANGAQAAVRVPPEHYRAAASFDAEASGRALEAAIPWIVLFPDAPVAVDPEPGAPAAPIFVLPPEASARGLRLVAVVVDASDGLGAADVAPDNTAGVAADRRDLLVVDRALRVDWDAARAGLPQFVDFGAAVQTQAAARFVPLPLAAPVVLQLENLRTFAGVQPSRLLLADAGLDLAFTFDIGPPVPSAIYVSATVVSLRGDRLRDLYHDARRTPGAPVPPFAPFGDATRDRWDGRDSAGHPVPGGIYILTLSAGLAPGSDVAETRRAITVVR